MLELCVVLYLKVLESDLLTVSVDVHNKEAEAQSLRQDVASLQVRLSRANEETASGLALLGEERRKVEQLTVLLTGNTNCFHVQVVQYMD